MEQKKGIAILGSTGSIGTQALEVIEAYPDKFDLQVLSAYKNGDLLIEQSIKHKPNTVVIGDPFDDEVGTYAGSNKVFDWNGTNWLYTCTLNAITIIQFFSINIFCANH